MNKWNYIENIVTMSVIAAIILGLYYMGGGYWGFISLILLTNMNYPTGR